MSVALLVACYLLGSIPWGLLVVRWRHGVDVRTYGSGSTGTTNVLRTAGGKVAVLVFLMDAAKGAVAVVLAHLVTDNSWLIAGAALAALIGHIWPVFAKFRGGRGVATGEGSLLALMPIAAGFTWLPVAGLLVWVPFVPVLLFTRYMSLASIMAVATAAIALAILSLTGFYPTGYLLYAVVGGVLIIFGHRANLKRLMEGKELKLGQRKLLDTAGGPGSAR